MKFMIWEPSWEPESEAELYSAPSLEAACILWAVFHPEWDDNTVLDVSVRLENGDVVSCDVHNLDDEPDFVVTVLATTRAEEYEQGDGQ